VSGEEKREARRCEIANHLAKHADINREIDSQCAAAYRENGLRGGEGGRKRE